MAEPARVALLRDPCETPGSMQFYAEGLSRALPAAGVVPAPLPPPAAFPPDPGPLDKAARYLERYWRAPRRLGTARADLYHILDHANAHWLRQLPAERTLVTCHDLILLKLAAGEISWRGARPRLATWALRFSVSHLPRAAAVVCDSLCTLRDAGALLGCAAERLRVVRPGVNASFQPRNDPTLHDAFRRRFGLERAVTLLHVGHSLFYKNIEGVLEGLAALPVDWLKRVRLVKAGADFTPAQWDLARRRGLSDRVRAVGHLDLPDLAVLYNVADLLVFPSLDEGFGWPPLEAMASGTPVVCSARGALAELPTEATCRVEPEDPADIARGIVRTLEDADYRRGRISCGLAHAGRLTWQRAAQEMSAVYAGVMTGS